MDSTSASPAARPRQIAAWLLVVAALVFLMVVVGGITRLTESGLSITEWQPVSGTIPPLNAADWNAAFALYQATPEYREINGPAGMDLAAFKVIFFWEWFHRLLGRVVGLAFALPLAWFALKRGIPRGYGSRLVALLLLGASQGALGWYMVQSGLADRTDVSHFRLSAHLLTALLILGGLVWTALDLRLLARTGENRPARLTPLTIGVIAVLVVQLLLGAWVAGLNAGAIASDWPLMQGKLVPDGIDTARGAGFALTHDPYLIHFLHRWWAWIALAALVVLARRVKPIDRRASIAIHSALGLQILLGIATVMSGTALWLAASHQTVGALLVAATAWGAHVVGRARMTVVTVYAVFADAAEAEAIGRAMVEERLAACVNILGPCRSIYRWEGKIETAGEVPALFKTTLDQADALIARIAASHSYDTPAIVTWPIDKLLAGYGDWVEGTVGC